MAMSTANLSQTAITEIQAAVIRRGGRGYDVTLDNIMFIFGLVDDGDGDAKQDILLDAGRWFSSQTWIDGAVIEWHTQKVWLYNPMPSTE